LALASGRGGRTRKKFASRPASGPATSGTIIDSTISATSEATDQHRGSAPGPGRRHNGRSLARALSPAWPPLRSPDRPLQTGGGTGGTSGTSGGTGTGAHIEASPRPGEPILCPIPYRGNRDGQAEARSGPNPEVHRWGITSHHGAWWSSSRWRPICQPGLT
jgi:hypothetical protein